MSEELRQVSERVRRIKEARTDEIDAVISEMAQLPREERELLCQAIGKMSGER